MVYLRTGLTGVCGSCAPPRRNHSQSAGGIKGPIAIDSLLRNFRYFIYIEKKFFQCIVSPRTSYVLS
jgi:hypothetical protein